MISLKAIQTSFNNPNKHDYALFPSISKELSRKKNSIILPCSSKPNDSDSEASSSSPEGDTRKQELLARIAMLQTQKLRLTDYLDERSTYLTQFAEEAAAEIDQIGENALKELDEAGARIMENIENQMQAFEESSELNKQEIEDGERKMVDFEDQMEEDRNEGLFFKSLRKKTPITDKAQVKEEMEKVKELTKENAGSKTRRNIYLAMIGLVAVGIVDSLVSFSPPSDWRKAAVLGVVLVGLLSQLIYEQSMLSEVERKEENKKAKETQ